MLASAGDDDLFASRGPFDQFGPVRLHRHSAVQVVFTLDEPVDTTLDGQVWSRVFGFVADSDCPHECGGPLRDPADFEEAGRCFLLYAVKGEGGIAIAALLERA